VHKRAVSHIGAVVLKNNYCTLICDDPAVPLILIVPFTTRGNIVRGWVLDIKYPLVPGVRLYKIL
jgi:hypothetical protein